MRVSCDALERGRSGYYAWLKRAKRREELAVKIKAIQPTIDTPGKLRRSFYARPAVDLARDLIGKILVHRLRGKLRRARIVETEAYVGTHDLACHASKGRTARTEVMFGRGGHAYVYFIYGMHEMFNIVASIPGDAQAVLIRAAEPLDGWTADLSGPGKLARALQITRAHYGLDLTGSKLFIVDNPGDASRIETTPRIGVDYSGPWRLAPLRFIDSTSNALSKSKLTLALIKKKPGHHRRLAALPQTAGHAVQRRAAPPHRKRPPHASAHHARPDGTARSPVDHGCGPRPVRPPLPNRHRPGETGPPAPARQTVQGGGQNAFQAVFSEPAKRR